MVLHPFLFYLFFHTTNIRQFSEPTKCFNTFNLNVNNVNKFAYIIENDYLCIEIKRKGYIMNGKKFDKLFNNAVNSAKNKLIDILNKLFIENHNNDYEIVFKENIYYYVSNGFCYPKRMWLNTNHRIVIERGFDWEDLTTDEEEICVDDMSLKDLIEFCEFITDDFENNIK